MRFFIAFNLLFYSCSVQYIDTPAKAEGKIPHIKEKSKKQNVCLHITFTENFLKTIHKKEYLLKTYDKIEEKFKTFLELKGFKIQKFKNFCDYEIHVEFDTLLTEVKIPENAEKIGTFLLITGTIIFIGFSTILIIEYFKKGEILSPFPLFDIGILMLLASVPTLPFSLLFIFLQLTTEVEIKSVLFLNLKIVKKEEKIVLEKNYHITFHKKEKWFNVEDGVKTISKLFDNLFYKFFEELDRDISSL